MSLVLHHIHQNIQTTMKTVTLLITSLLLATSFFNTTPKSDLKEQTVAKQYHTNTIHLEPDTNVIKVALLLDTSNSMDGLIDQAKSQLWELVNELSYAKCKHESKPSLQIAL